MTEQITQINISYGNNMERHTVLDLSSLLFSTCGHKSQNSNKLTVDKITLLFLLPILLLADPSSKNCRDGVNLLGISVVDQTGTCDKSRRWQR